MASADAERPRLVRGWRRPPPPPRDGPPTSPGPAAPARAGLALSSSGRVNSSLSTVQDGHRFRLHKSPLSLHCEREALTTMTTDDVARCRRRLRSSLATSALFNRTPDQRNIYLIGIPFVESAEARSVHAAARAHRPYASEVSHVLRPGEAATTLFSANGATNGTHVAVRRLYEYRSVFSPCTPRSPRRPQRKPAAMPRLAVELTLAALLPGELYCPC